MSGINKEILKLIKDEHSRIQQMTNIYFHVDKMAKMSDKETYSVSLIAEKVAHGEGEIRKRMKELIRDIEYEFKDSELEEVVVRLYDECERI